MVSIAPDGAGGCLIVWQDDRNAIGDPNLDIYAQRVSAAGVPLWTANGRAVCSAPGTQYLPKVVGDGIGGAYITWEDEASSVPRVYVHHLTAAGSIAPGWPANGIVLGNTGPLGAQYSPAIAADGEGGVLIAWSGSNNHVVFHSFVQRVGAAGAIAPGWLAAGTQLCNLLQTQDIPQVVSDRTGGAIVVWRDWRDITNPFVNYDIYAQRVNALGVPQWMTNGVPMCTAPGSQDIPAAVGDDQGGVVVAWEDYRGGGGESDIYALRLTPAGVRAPGWDADGTALCALSGYQTGPVLVPDGLAGAIVAWSDSRPAPRFQAADIYAARTPDDIVVPVLASLVGASAQPDRVVLAWQIPGAAVSARVWRRAAGEAWAVIGSVASAGDGRLAFEDLDVRAGESYDYRLGLVQDDGEIFAGETRVTVPGFSAFALEGARPNPAADGLALAFTLPDGAPAVLEVLDIGGRVLEAHPVGELGAGRHVVQMSAGTPLRPGLYYARLRRAGRSLTARVAVIR